MQYRNSTTGKTYKIFKEYLILFFCTFGSVVYGKLAAVGERKRGILSRQLYIGIKSQKLDLYSMIDSLPIPHSLCLFLGNFYLDFMYWVWFALSFFPCSYINGGFEIYFHFHQLDKQMHS
jgi:hypothetical protein